MAYKKRKKNDENFVDHFIDDIKRNGAMYVRSPILVQRIKAIDPSITFEYLREDDLFMARYSIGSVDNGSD